MSAIRSLNTYPNPSPKPPEAAINPVKSRSKSRIKPTKPIKVKIIKEPAETIIVGIPLSGLMRFRLIIVRLKAVSAVNAMSAICTTAMMSISENEKPSDKSASTNAKILPNV